MSTFVGPCRGLLGPGSGDEITAGFDASLVWVIAAIAGLAKRDHQLARARILIPLATGLLEMDLGGQKDSVPFGTP